MLSIDGYTEAQGAAWLKAHSKQLKGVGALYHRNHIALDAVLDRAAEFFDVLAYDPFDDTASEFTPPPSTAALFAAGFDAICELAELKPNEIELLRLLYVERLTQREAGRILGRHQCSISVAHRKIILKLRDRLQN